MYSLKINFEQKGLEPVTLNDIKPDHSLLELLLDAGTASTNTPTIMVQFNTCI